MHSWRAVLLPYIEQSPLENSIDWNRPATDAINESVSTMVVASYICPSGTTASSVLHLLPTSRLTQPIIFHAVRSDYDGLAGIWDIFEDPPPGTLDGTTRYLRWSVWGSATFDDGTVCGKIESYREGKFKDVTDGLSNTILVAERAGRPTHLVNGRPAVTEHNPTATYLGQIGWSASSPFYRQN